MRLHYFFFTDTPQKPLETKTDDNLFNDELLNKIMGETTSTPNTSAGGTQQIQTPNSTTSVASTVATTSDSQMEEMLQSFDVDSVLKFNSSQKEGQETSKDEEEMGSGDEAEESTYVLPADKEEWTKLFELVRSQVAANSLSSEEMLEAKRLLPYEKNIHDEGFSIEKQVEIFNSLCTLSNLQMS